MINRNHAYTEPTSQTLDKASRDPLEDYPEIGHVEEYFLPFIYFFIIQNIEWTMFYEHWPSMIRCLPVKPMSHIRPSFLNNHENDFCFKHKCTIDFVRIIFMIY